MEMFDEVKVVYVPDNQQLVEIVDRREAELDLREAQITFINLSAAWEQCHKYNTMRELDRAEKRLIDLFHAGDWGTKPIRGQAWSDYRRHLLYHVKAKS